MLTLLFAGQAAQIAPGRAFTVSATFTPGTAKGAAASTGVALVANLTFAPGAASGATAAAAPGASLVAGVSFVPGMVTGASIIPGFAPGASLSASLTFVPGVASVEEELDDFPFFGGSSTPKRRVEREKKPVVKPAAAPGATLASRVSFTPGTARGAARAPAASWTLGLQASMTTHVVGAARAAGALMETEGVFFAPEGVSQADFLAELLEADERMIASMTTAPIMQCA